MFKASKVGEVTPFEEIEGVNTKVHKFGFEMFLHTLYSSVQFSNDLIKILAVKEFSTD